MRLLTGKTSLVTGASCGIGRASALALANAGAQVLVHSNSDEKEADEVVAEIRAIGCHAQKVAVDLRTPDGPYRLATLALTVIGARLDILVASTDISTNTSFEDTTTEDFDGQFAVNVRAPSLLVQHLMPTICKRSIVIFFSSVPVRASIGTLSTCAVTKDSIAALVKHIAAALGARGARVNAVAPAMAESDTSSIGKTKSGAAATRCQPTLKRVAGPEDMGAAVVFLASDEGSGITGETLSVGPGANLSIE